MDTRWTRLSFSSLIAMNIQEDEQKEHCYIPAVESQVFGGRKHCWSNDGGRERKRNMEGSEIYMCVWDLKGTASGCLGYLFPCKEKEAFGEIGQIRSRCYSGQKVLFCMLCENMSSPLTCCWKGEIDWLFFPTSQGKHDCKLAMAWPPFKIPTYWSILYIIN